MSLMLASEMANLDRNAIYLVTSAQTNVCMNVGLLTDYKMLSKPKLLRTVYGTTSVIEGEGTLVLIHNHEKIIIPNVAYVPGFNNNQLNPRLLFKPNQPTHFLLDANGMTSPILGRFGIVDPGTNLYKLTLKIQLPTPRAPLPEDENAIYFNTSSDHHVCRDWTLLHNYKPFTEPSLITINKKKGYIMGTGTLKLVDENNGIYLFRDIPFVPEINRNIVNPIRLLSERNDRLSFDGNCITHSRFGKIGVRDGLTALYRTTLHLDPPTNRAHQSRKRKHE